MEQVWLNNYHSSVPKEINIQEYQSLVHLFNTAVKKFKNQPAFTNFGKTISYNELDKLSNQFASYLSDTLKLEKGDRIAIQMPNLLQYPIAMFGALKAGLIVVNTNPLYTSREMKHQFKDSGAKAIVIFANSAKDLETIIKDTSIEHVVVTEIGDMLGFAKGTFYNFAVKYLKKMVPKYNLPASVSFKNALSQGSPNYKPVDFNQTDIAFLQYTGGTTGVSKGAILTHKNILANTLQIFAWLKPKLKEGKEIMITPLPLYHIFSLTVNCLALMSYGAHNILITNPRDIDGFIKELKKWPFTVMTSLNTLFNALLNNEKLKEVDFSNCHFGVAGGMAMQNFVAKEWKKVTGTDVVEGYGLTEASPVVTCNPTDGNHRMGSVGMPLPSTQVKLVTESGEAVGVGEEGELLVKGPQVM